MGMSERDTKAIIKKDLLRRLAESRLREANALYSAGYYQGAIYLAGYAVVCWLKVAICRALDWDELYDTFKRHDLMFLLRHSGLFRRISDAPKVNINFRKIMAIWFWDNKVELRYCDPDSYSADRAKHFLHWVADKTEGVVPWLSKQVS